MNGGHADWVRKKNELVAAIKHLGFPAALGEQVAANLGGIKAMDRMIAYLNYVKPKRAELVEEDLIRSIMTIKSAVEDSDPRRMVK